MISSQLQCQLFSKIATWDILTANNLVWGHLDSYQSSVISHQLGK